MPRKDDIRQLIDKHNRRLQKLKEQQAQHGISVDPKIPLEIEDIETEITKLEAELADLATIPYRNPYRGLSAFREEDADIFLAGRPSSRNW